MILNLNEVSKFPESGLAVDVAIVGGGAAGITAAKKLASLGKSIALIEAGGLEYSSESQALYKGKVQGDPYFELDKSRLRFFGGSTNHWSGWCRPFERIDFNRGYLGKEYEWPIRFEDLDQFRQEACAILEIPGTFEDELGQATSIRKIDFNFSPPVRFGNKYHSQLASNSETFVLLNSNLIDVVCNAGVIDALFLESYNGNGITVRAKKIIFAMGGIENSRYLLWFRKKYGDNFCSNSPAIGRYWMEHPHFTLGEALIDKRVVRNRFYSLDPSVQVENKTLNCGFRVHHLTRTGSKALLADLLCLAPSVGKGLVKMFDANLLCGARFRAAWEQAPDQDNFIALGRTLDRFGIPKVVLNWRKTDLDRETITKSVASFNQWLLALDGGRLRLASWLANDQDYPVNDELAGNHHMGGTRMHSSSKLGVVDSDCKVYGSKNLFISGSSVFTTGGHNNPTLPIVQLALRLASHLGSLK